MILKVLSVTSTVYDCEINTVNVYNFLIFITLDSGY
jgi:hypothetical protein